MKRLLTAVLVPALLQAGVCAFAASGPTFKRNDGAVIVEGTADSASEMVTMKVYNEEGRLIYIRQSKTDNMKKYKFSFTPNISEKENLTIQVKCAGSESIDEISAIYEVVSDNNGTDYDPPAGGGKVSSGGSRSVSYGSKGGSASAVKTDSQNTSDDKENGAGGASGLKDVKGHWGENDINFLYEKGIVTGDTSGNFFPDAKIKRSEFLALAVRALGIESAAYEGSFGDVKEDAWYSGIVQAALNSGIISKDTLFRPDDPVTRQEMVKIIISSKNEADEETENIKEFSDSESISEWAKPYVSAALRLGLVKGDENGRFNPQSGATKAEAAAVIKRMLAK